MGAGIDVEVLGGPVIFGTVRAAHPVTCKQN